MPPGTDPKLLRQQYADDRALRIRQEIHERYSVPHVDFPAWVIKHVEWRGDERVLDAGCGSGTYYSVLQKQQPSIHYTGLDLSAGMLALHPGRGCLTQGNIERLPFAAGSFDLVMANDMLFHVQDIDNALQECRRVLTAEGVLVAATSSNLSMPEFGALYRRALLLLGVSGKAYNRVPAPVHDSFALENGARHLSRYFYAVVRYDLPTVLMFFEVEPIMAYLESTRILQEPQLPDSVRWDDLMGVMRDQISALLGHFQKLEINLVNGILVASDRGGFVRDFANRRQRSRARPSAHQE